jgi:hypothetical protein
MAPQKLENNFFVSTLTYLLHGAEFFLRTRKIIGVSGKSRILCNPFLLWKS